MSDPTFYCVQVYGRDHGALAPIALWHFPTPEEACRRAQLAATDWAGAVAFEFQGRPEHEIWGEPRFLAAYGEARKIGKARA